MADENSGYENVCPCGEVFTGSRFCTACGYDAETGRPAKTDAMDAPLTRIGRHQREREPTAKLTVIDSRSAVAGLTVGASEPATSGSDDDFQTGFQTDAQTDAQTGVPTGFHANHSVPETVVFTPGVDVPAQKIAVVQVPDIAGHALAVAALVKDAPVAVTADPLAVLAGAYEQDALGIETNAVTVPDVDVTHPTTPHLVCCVDTRSRRSRDVRLAEPAAVAPFVFPLTGEHLCGRMEGVDIQLPSFDRKASNLHLKFTRLENGSFTVADLSSNGTKIDGRYIRKLAHYPLKNGQVITLGNWMTIGVFIPTELAKPAPEATKQ